MNPAEWLHRTAQREALRQALFTGETLQADYAGFRDAAARLGAGLTAKGIVKGDRVAVFMSNRVEYLIALYVAALDLILPIYGSLLDRFLACMKPASMT